MSDAALIQAIAHPDDQAALSQHIGENLACAECRSITYRIITRDGRHRWIEHKCQAVFGSDGSYRGQRASNRDVTERVQGEEFRKVMIETLEAQNSELERFAYTVSHDLKSPLITIQGFATLAHQDILHGRTIG